MSRVNVALSNVAFLLLYAAMVGALGAIVGLNLPLGIVCKTQDSLCYRFRYWGQKMAID